MGAWGEKGYDNDTACDWLGELSTMLHFTFDNAFYSRWDEQGIAAAQLLLELPETLQMRMGVFCFNEALGVVERCLQPEELKPWRYPSKRKAYLTGLHRKILVKQKAYGKQEKETKARLKKVVVRRGMIKT